MELSSEVREALDTLVFENLVNLPKLKEIRKKYLKLSSIHHPDKNGGSIEAKQNFQRILSAYEIAGKACEDVVYDDDDEEDKLARKIFKQFCFTSVKENMNSFTIKTEKKLFDIWKRLIDAI